jgi:hypothetical protein
MNIECKRVLRPLIALSTHKVVYNHALLYRCMFCASNANRYISLGPGVTEGARGLPVLHMFLSSTVVSLFVHLKIEHFRPGPTRCATDSLSDLLHIFLACLPLPEGGGARNIFFSSVP